MPGLDDAIKEIRELEQWDREQEVLKERVRSLEKERDKILITKFVQDALDHHIILQYDGIFKYIDTFVNERNK